MNMRKLWVAALLFNLSTLSYAGTQSSATPEEVIRNLYTAHQPQNDKELDFNDTKNVSKYFSPELTRLLAREDECRRETREICNLEFDPMLDAQDVENEPLNLKIEKISAKIPLRFKVTFTNIGRRSIVYELMDTDRGWRISDIIYPKGSSLREILSREIPR